ncbi:sigma-70 family RNA polymerase sigma factor [Mycobacterium avium]|nr:sigma-70 family RNA polymerase sigma factor [Mycobacterium avium]
MSDPDEGIDTSRDGDEDRYEVLLHPDNEMASPEWYPRLMNMSAAFMFRAVIRPDVPASPEYVTIPMQAADREARLTKQLAVSKWNTLWEAAQYRRRFFTDDECPPEMLKIIDQGDINVVFVPRTKTRYFEYAPLFHLLPRRTLERFGLPLYRGGQWPFLTDVWSPDRYLPANFAHKLSRAWAATVWRHLMPGSPLIGFTKDDPIRLLAHDLDFWIPPIIQVMEAEMRTWPEVDKGVEPQAVTLNDGSVLRGATAVNPRVGGELWTGEDDAAEFVRDTVEAADGTGRLRAILDAVRSHRVEDDFSHRWSYAREDFERKLHRKRSKVKVRFVELTDTIPVQGPETEIVDRLVFNDFLALLDPREREVVVLLRSGTTKLTEIADIMGYRNHSPISKRLKRIREAADRFFDEG